MSIEDSDAALRIVEAGRQRVLARMRDAFANQAAAHADLGEIDPAVLDRLVHEAAEQAGTSVWRISLAEGASDEFGLGVSDALAHPAVSAAEQLVGPADDLVAAPDSVAAPELATSREPEPETASATVQEPWTAPEPTAFPEPVAGPDPIAGADPVVAPETAAEPEHDPWAAPAESEDEEPSSEGWGEPAREPPAAAEPPVPEPRMPAWNPNDLVEPEPEPVTEPPAPTVEEPALEAPAPEAPVPEPEPAPVAAAAPAAGEQPQALRIPAVHTSGIETLKQGDKDLELRLSDAGLDVLRHSTGVAIGRLDWGEITAVEIEQTKKGLRGRKRSQTLQVRTSRGQATFELPGLSDEEAAEHLQPMLDRLRETGLLAAATE